MQEEKENIVQTEKGEEEMEVVVVNGEGEEEKGEHRNYTLFYR